MSKMNLLVGLTLFSCSVEMKIDDSVITGGGGSTGTTPSLSCSGGPTTFSTDMNARYVIGQPDFVSNLANQGNASPSASTMSGPIGIYVKNSKLYVADAGNNRILVYNTLPTSNGASADVVVGQPDFVTGSSGTSATKMNGLQNITVDDNYIAATEWTNNRVSFWPLSNLTTAVFAWGQNNLTTAVANNDGTGVAGARSASTISTAAGLALGGGKYFVGEVGTYRTLMFDATSLSTYQAATNVIGQADYTSNTISSANNKMGYVYGITTDGNKLALVDNYNDRVMIYNSIPSSPDAAADVVWGGWGVDSTHLNNPVGVFYSGDYFFIADRGSDRVLVFNSVPTSAATVPDYVIGQPNYNTSDHNQCNCAVAKQNSLWGVHHVYWDGCRLYVTDRQNNRVLVY